MGSSVPSFFARATSRAALAHRGELVAHAAVVVVIGDLLAGDAARDATAAQVGELVNALPGD
jgi:hypothetical protein